MKKRQHHAMLIISALLCLLLLAACGEKSTAVTITLVNRSGQPVSELYITPTTTDEWGDTLLVEPLEDGDMQQIGLGTYSKEELDAGFNILVYNTEDELFYDTPLDEQTFSIADGDYLVFLPTGNETSLDITATYDSSKYDDLAAAPTEFFYNYVGSWKYDSLPAYLTIDEDGSWYIMNLYAEHENSGTVTMSEDIADLYLDDGTYYNSLALSDEVTLADGDGNLLIYSPDMPLLPSTAEELNQSISFPGSFAAVSVSYASSMDVQPNPAYTDALYFTPVLGDGTDDCYSAIAMLFYPITGYDEQMTSGLGTAQPQLESMLQAVLGDLYGDQLLETASSLSADWGNYYSITANISVAGAVMSADLADTLSGTVEIRYYGPTGYVLVSAALAPAHRIDTYAAISQSMLNACTYTIDWATAPKSAPETPGTPATTTTTDGSDPGDTNTPYYWYDEDGDIWYWDGYKNEFIGFGDSYYIDDDGQYYESNDAGWDYDDPYYDDWSDPGDYGYYDDWSDPGDYGYYDDWYDDDYYYDDYDYYEYYDDGWGDDF